MDNGRRTTVSRTIRALRKTVYAAFLDPHAVATWLPTGSMRSIVHAFEHREGDLQGSLPMNA
jgi:uncharacterized protein YndB with AHSA1/START domain